MTDSKALLELAARCEAAVMPFGDYYAVSEMGDVWSRRRGAWALLRPTPTDRGYLRLSLSVNGARRDLRLNRIVCEAWHGPPPFPSSVARHLNDDRVDNRPVNLAWGSQSENVADAKRNGRFCDPVANARAGAHKIRGQANPAAKLTWATVREIRERAASGQSISAIARELGVERSNASLIARGKTWKECAKAATPALALCAASLRAIAQEQDNAS